MRGSASWCQLPRYRHLGSVGLRLCPDGESDIIWSRGLDLTPTDAQHRFAEASELLAKLKKPSSLQKLYAPLSQAFKHQEILRGVAPGALKATLWGFIERVPKLPRPDTASGLCSPGDSPRSPSAYDLASPAHWRVPRRQLSQQQPEQ